MASYKKMKCKAVIFDLDGTLFDTRDVMHICGNHALKKLGLPTFSRERYGYFSGGGIEEFVFGILDAAGEKDHHDFEAFWQLYLDKTKEIGDEVNTVFPGIYDLISELKKRKIKIAVLSNKDQPSCIQIIEKLFGKGTFDIIFGNTIGFPPKPDPAGMIKVLDELGIDKSEAIYIGDTEIDMKTAINSSVPIAIALWGYRPQEVIEKYKPFLTLSYPTDLISQLD